MFAVITMNASGRNASVEVLTQVTASGSRAQRVHQDADSLAGDSHIDLWYRGGACATAVMNTIQPRLTH